MAKAKKKTESKPKIKTIKLGFEPNNTVTYNHVQYQKLPNGNYLNKSTREEVKIEV